MCRKTCVCGPYIYTFALTCTSRINLLLLSLCTNQPTPTLFYQKNTPKHLNPHKKHFYFGSLEYYHSFHHHNKVVVHYAAACCVHLPRPVYSLVPATIAEFQYGVTAGCPWCRFFWVIHATDVNLCNLRRHTSSPRWPSSHIHPVVSTVAKNPGAVDCSPPIKERVAHPVVKSGYKTHSYHF